MPGAVLGVLAAVFLCATPGTALADAAWSLTIAPVVTGSGTHLSATGDYRKGLNVVSLGMRGRIDRTGTLLPHAPGFLLAYQRDLGTGDWFMFVRPEYQGEVFSNRERIHELTLSYGLAWRFAGRWTLGNALGYGFAWEEYRTGDYRLNLFDLTGILQVLVRYTWE